MKANSKTTAIRHTRPNSRTDAAQRAAVVNASADSDLGAAVSAYWQADRLLRAAEDECRRLAHLHSDSAETELAAACDHQLSALDAVLAFIPRTLAGLAAQLKVFKAGVEGGDGDEARTGQMVSNATATLAEHTTAAEAEAVG